MPKLLNRNLSPELDSISSQPTYQEPHTLSTIHEESDLGDEQIAPFQDLIVASTGDAITQLEDQPQGQPQQIIINSVSPLNFFQHEDMPLLELGHHFVADPSEPPFFHVTEASIPAEEDNDQFNPNHDDARFALEVVRASLSKFVLDSISRIHLTLETRDIAITLRSYITLKESSWKDQANIFFHFMEDLMIKEHNLEREFQSFEVTTARNQFMSLVLS